MYGNIRNNPIKIFSNNFLPIAGFHLAHQLGHYPAMPMSLCIVVTLPSLFRMLKNCVLKISPRTSEWAPIRQGSLFQVLRHSTMPVLSSSMELEWTIFDQFWPWRR